MTVSTLPILFACQVLFMFVAAFKASARQAVLASAAIAVALAIWGAASSLMALQGVYASGRFLQLMPGLWLPLVPFLVVAISLAFRPIRVGVLHLADTVPTHWFVAIQALRVFAIGTLVKTLWGDFPLEVELAIGLTDLAFGLSAIWLYFKAQAGKISADALVGWHIVGVLIIVIPGEIAIQSGLPGPWRVFSEHPTSEVMLDWPMVLAPSLVLPVFLLFNILGAVAAHRGFMQITKDNLT